MKATNWFFLVSLCVSTNAFAAQCATDNLKTEFLGYDMKNSEPKYNEKLNGRYGDAVLPEFIKYNETNFASSASRVAAFRCLVSVEAAAQKWDDGSGIELLATVAKNSSFKKVLDNELQQFPDQCRAGLLKASVEARICHDGHGNRETPEQSAKCEQEFSKNNFPGCQDFSSAEKKSQNKVAAQPCSSSTPRQATGVTSAALGALKNAITNQAQLAAVSSTTANGVAQTGARSPASISNPANGSSPSRGPASVSPTYYPPEESAVSQ